MRLRREDPRVVGSFKLHRRLGAGGMGVVYLGSDRRGQRVALKVIRPDLAEDPEFRSRFAREVSAARRIQGGCTARLVAADLDTARPWFATQYVPGPSLHDKVNEAGPLPPAQVAAIGAALSEGLVAVHEAGVVHRDLKPSNILLSPKGPRIIDFGIAWATGASTLTHIGTAVGSPGFLAPEQVRGSAVTPATDVFSLGATLAYAATGESPFGQGSSEVMLYRVVHEEPHLADVPPALAPLLRACLAKDRADRPTTLQLSLRLKEIAAREARGLSDSERGGPVDGVRDALTAPPPSGPRHPRPGEVPRRGGRRAVPRSAQRPTPREGRPREATRAAAGSWPPAAARRTPPRSAAPTPGRGAPPQRPTGATGRRTGGGRPPGGSPPPRAGAGRATGGRRPGPARRPNPRLLRQRLIVFVTVTVLVALGIATAQGCQGPLHGLRATAPHQTGGVSQQHEPPAR